MRSRAVANVILAATARLTNNRLAIGACNLNHAPISKNPPSSLSRNPYENLAGIVSIHAICDKPYLHQATFFVIARIAHNALHFAT